MHTEPTSISAVRRQPKQTRSRLLVASIRQACWQLLQRPEEAPITAKRIAEVAGVTIGSFYQYYLNKEAVLFDVLLEHAPGEADRISSEARFLLGDLRWQSLPQTLAGLVQVTCERHRRFWERYGDIYRSYHRQVPFERLILDRARQYVDSHSLEEWMRDTLAHHYPEASPATLSMAAFLMTGTLYELCAKTVDEHPEWLASAAFRQQLAQLLMGYAETLVATQNPVDPNDNSKEGEAR